jgi:hypothetical protein
VNVIVLCIVPFFIWIGWVGLLWCCTWETIHSTAWYSAELVWSNDITVWLADLEPKKYVSWVEWKASQLAFYSSSPPRLHTHTLKVCTMVQVVSCWPLTAEILIPGQSTWDVWSMKWHWNQLFFKVLQFSTVTIIPPIHTHISFIFHW